MDGWMDNEKRMMVEGERELRRVSMTRLGCLVAYPKSGRFFKVRPKMRPLVATRKVQIGPRRYIRSPGGGIALSNDQ